MFVPRPYQEKAIQAPFQHWSHSEENCLIVMPTASGKALTIAEFIKRACEQYPTTRILVLSHVAKLLKQNAMTLVRQWSSAPFGFYSAQLGKRQASAQILFGGIQSVHKKAYQIGYTDLILIDEVHLLSPDNNTMYRRFIADLRKINPKLKIAGYTATDYRQGQGKLTDGKNSLFKYVTYEVPVSHLIEEGYLTPVETPPQKTQMDVSDVGMRGEEFIINQLEKAVDKDEITKACVSEITEFCKMRHKCLVFCVTVNHAKNTVAEFERRGASVELITGDTPENERDAIYMRMEKGETQYIVNVFALTTGIDLPFLDVIAFMRPMRSASSYVQAVGRVMRLIDGAIGNLPTKEERIAAIERSRKPKAYVLDFGGVVDALGPIDNVNVPKAKGDGTGEAPFKQCPECLSINHAAVRICFECEYEFPEPEPKISAGAGNGAILSSQIESSWVEVEEVDYHRHTKAGRPDSICVTYHTGLEKFREWVCPEHEGYAKTKFAKWWVTRGGTDMFGLPSDTDEALEYIYELPTPHKIQVRPNGKYQEIINYEF